LTSTGSPGTRPPDARKTYVVVAVPDCDPTSVQLSGGRGAGALLPVPTVTNSTTRSPVCTASGSETVALFWTPGNCAVDAARKPSDGWTTIGNVVVFEMLGS